MGATIQWGLINRLKHGCIHPVNESCNDHNNPQNRNLDLNRENPRSCAPSRPEQRTSSSMRIWESKSNMQEHRLITSQWWKLLTDARGTTNNENGPQGTIGTIYGMWISETALNTRRIIRSEANDENLASNTKNLPLRHVGSKAPIGSL